MTYDPAASTPADLELPLEDDHFFGNNPLILRAPKARLEGWANALPSAASFETPLRGSSGRGAVHSVRARTCSRLAKNFCQPNLAPW
jgi:hypothetical protein